MMSKLLLTFGILSLAATSAWSHARLKQSAAVLPRSSNAGVKSGPCGGFPRAPASIVIEAGKQVTVTWEETINHKGRYEFYFSPANDSNFTLLQTVIDVQDDPIVMENYHQYSTTVTLPPGTCDNCTLQMIQVMLDNPDVPSYYYSCADMKLVAPGTPIPPGTNPVPPTTTPPPTPGCH